MASFPHASIPEKMQEDEGTALFMDNVLSIISALQIFGNGLIIRAGSGSPESVVTANPGSLYMRTDGPPSLYVKESGLASKFGWTAK